MYSMARSLTIEQPVIHIAHLSSIGKSSVQLLSESVDSLIRQRFVSQYIRHGEVF